MKMGTGLIIGIIIILIGLSVVLKGLGIRIPLMQIIFGVFLIYLGVKALMGGFGIKNTTSSGNTVFGESRYFASDLTQKEYNVAFGKSNFYLEGISFDETRKLEINVVFGAAEIHINDDVPLRISGNTVFGGTKMPNGNAAAFGTTNYQSKSFREDAPYLDIRVNVVFGGVELSKRVMQVTH